MLEYGEGIHTIRLSAQILGDVVFSAVDGTTLTETIWVYSKMALRELVVNRKCLIGQGAANERSKFERHPRR